MTIKVGDTLPRVKLMAVDDSGSHEVQTEDLFHGKLVVLFAVPGAFTPTCSARHLPGYVQNYEAFIAAGVDLVCCVSVNDAFVMSAWAADQKSAGKLVLLADGSAIFTKAMGLELDLTARNMGIRSQRYALIARDGKVVHLAVEPPGGFDASRAEVILEHIK